MKILPFENIELARQRNKEIAISQGCTGSVTSYWFGEYEDENITGLIITDESLLTDIERERIIDYAPPINEKII